MSLPWSERIPMLSIHPDAATRDEVARLAAELMDARAALAQARVAMTETVPILYALMAKPEGVLVGMIRETAERLQAALGGTP
jgi:capsule polysaccharide export protein KpsE/RkpR